MIVWVTQASSNVLHMIRFCFIGRGNPSTITFESHICEKVNKATSIFGALRRAFRYLDKKLFIPLYKTMVRLP
jgi:hypothetical protein